MKTLFRSFGLLAGPGWERPGTGPHSGHVVECHTAYWREASFHVDGVRLVCSCSAEYERKVETFPENLSDFRVRVSEQGDSTLLLD